MPTNIIIHIGTDGADEPGALVHQAIMAVLNNIPNARIAARIDGTGRSGRWGAEPSTWVAFEVPGVEVDDLDTYVQQTLAAKADLARVAKVHNQDAIAFTHGSTSMVEAAK